MGCKGCNERDGAMECKAMGVQSRELQTWGCKQTGCKVQGDAKNLGYEAKWGGGSKAGGRKAEGCRAKGVQLGDVQRIPSKRGCEAKCSAKQEEGEKQKGVQRTGVAE